MTSQYFLFKKGYCLYDLKFEYFLVPSRIVMLFWYKGSYAVATNCLLLSFLDHDVIYGRSIRPFSHPKSVTIFSNNPLNSTKILLIVILIKRGQKCVCHQTSLKQNFTFNKTFR